MTTRTPESDVSESTTPDAASSRALWLNTHLPGGSLYSDAKRPIHPDSRASWRLSPDPFWLPPDAGEFLERLGNDLGLKVADHLLSLPMRYYDRNRSGDILAVVGSDVTLVRSGTLGTALPLLSQVVRLGGSVAIAFYLNWRLAMIVVVITPLVMGIAITAGRRVRALSRETQQGIGEATAVLNEVLANIRVVKSFGREPHERARYWERMARVLQLGLRRTLVDSAVGPVITFLSFGAITAVLWFGGQEVLAGRLSAGDLVAFLIYLLGVAAPIGILKIGRAHV